MARPDWSACCDIRGSAPVQPRRTRRPRRPAKVRHVALGPFARASSTSLRRSGLWQVVTIAGVPRRPLARLQAENALTCRDAHGPRTGLGSRDAQRPRLVDLRHSHAKYETRPPKGHCSRGMVSSGGQYGRTTPWLSRGFDQDPWTPGPVAQLAEAHGLLIRGCGFEPHGAHKPQVRTATTAVNSESQRRAGLARLLPRRHSGCPTTWVVLAGHGHAPPGAAARAAVPVSPRPAATTIGDVRMHIRRQGCVSGARRCDDDVVDRPGDGCGVDGSSTSPAWVAPGTTRWRLLVDSVTVWFWVAIHPLEFPRSLVRTTSGFASRLRGPPPRPRTDSRRRTHRGPRSFSRWRRWLGHRPGTSAVDPEKLVSARSRPSTSGRVIANNEDTCFTTL